MTPLLRGWWGFFTGWSLLSPVRSPEERLRLCKVGAPSTELSLFWAGQRRVSSRPWGRPLLLSARAPGEGSLWAGLQDVGQGGGVCGGAGSSLAFLLKLCLSLKDSRFPLQSEHRIKLANLKIISPSSYFLLICLETSAS